MSAKRRIIDAIIDVEGGYVNDPADSGGETNYGVTVAVARRYGYTGDMRRMPRAMAFNIYSRMYWDSVRGNDLLAASEALAAEVVDTAVNMGVARAGTFLQRSLNVLNDGGRLYRDLDVDGMIGPKTILAVKAYLIHRSERELVKACNCLQGAFYIELAERREKDQRFVYGWLKHRVVL